MGRLTLLIDWEGPFSNEECFEKQLEIKFPPNDALNAAFFVESLRREASEIREKIARDVVDRLKREYQKEWGIAVIIRAGVYDIFQSERVSVEFSVVLEVVDENALTIS
ncbi:hypothetical protein [Thalassoglobus neptunius]|uniref:hypothetical protein n=1 Tax=Thalassoglobus neptunius TaxID=1938619 RepID=UPI0011B432D4|nr:hypothetical protein [Thalassoglobus neptunius]